MRGPLRRAAAGLLATATAALLITAAAVPAHAAGAPTPSASSSTAAPTGSPAPTAPPSTPPPAGRALAVQPLEQPVLTLPAGDGFDDVVRLRIRSGAPGAVDVLLQRGSKSLAVAKATPLEGAGADWSATVRVPVKPLKAGRWTALVRRSDAHGTAARTALRVGTGKPLHVALRPAQRTVYPWRDGWRDAVALTIAASDETGTALPVGGSVRLTAGSAHRTATITANAATVPVTGLRLGSAALVATVRGPSGTARRSTSVALAGTGLTALRLTASSDTVQPVQDGLLDSVTLTTSAAVTAGSPAKATGTLVVASADAVAQVWSVPDGGAHAFTWDGRVHGKVVPGIYTALLTMHGPQGGDQVRLQTIVVSGDHLPYRVRDLFDVAAGDQQGLAVHDGAFYVATDVGDGAARIDVYSAAGALLRSLGPLPIGHGAELSYSTTTGLLYAANGGAAFPTSVWAIDPAATDSAAAIRQTFDLSALGPNGMVAVDDAAGRLLVFAGTKGAYTVSAVALADGHVIDSVPIAISGTPQGMEVVGGELWLYTSMSGRNRIARYTVTDAAVVAAATGPAQFDLMNPGEGEGLAFSSDGLVYVGAHSPNRVGVLEPVADE